MKYNIQSKDIKLTLKENLVKERKKLTRDNPRIELLPMSEIKRSHCSIEQIAEYLEHDRMTYSRYEDKASDTIPPLEDLLKLCNLFGCDLDYLLGFNEYRYKETPEVVHTLGITSEASDILLTLTKDYYFDDKLPSGPNQIPEEVYLLDYLIRSEEGRQLSKKIIDEMYTRWGIRRLQGKKCYPVLIKAFKRTIKNAEGYAYSVDQVKGPFMINLCELVGIENIVEGLQWVRENTGYTLESCIEVLMDIEQTDTREAHLMALSLKLIQAFVNSHDYEEVYEEPGEETDYTNTGFAHPDIVYRGVHDMLEKTEKGVALTYLKQLAPNAYERLLDIATLNEMRPFAEQFRSFDETFYDRIMKTPELDLSEEYGMGVEKNAEK